MVVNISTTNGWIPGIMEEIKNKIMSKIFLKNFWSVRCKHYKEFIVNIWFFWYLIIQNRIKMLTINKQVHKIVLTLIFLILQLDSNGLWTFSWEEGGPSNCLVHLDDNKWHMTKTLFNTYNFHQSNFSLKCKYGENVDFSNFDYFLYKYGTNLTKSLIVFFMYYSFTIT